VSAAARSSEALRRFVAYQEQINVLKKRLINASIYPAVLLSAGLLVVLFLVAYVVPRFSSVYEEIGGELPLASRILMEVGAASKLDRHRPLVDFSASSLPVGYCRQASFRAAVGRSILKILAAIGLYMQTYQLARLYRTVGMLLRGGIPVVTAFEMTRGLLAANAQPRLVAATKAVREGQSLTEALANEGLTTAVASACCAWVNAAATWVK
jgi:general secretion pathway protein F